MNPAPPVEPPRAVELLVLFIALYRIIGGLMGPAWGSLMSEYLPPERRGDYFSRRSQLIGLFGMLATALAGLLLDGLKAAASASFAFAVLFSAPAIARLYSCRPMALMAPMPEPPESAAQWSWRGFLERVRASAVARFVVYVAAMTFATQLCSSYFSVHMLRDLGFGYSQYMSVHMGSSLAGFLAFPIWGRHADRAGNARVLRLTGLLTPVIPLLWLVAERPAALFAVELSSGFLWSGFNLCATNYLYELAPPAKRVRALGYFNLINGTAMFVGASLGGCLSTRLPALGGHALHSLFLLSAAARFAADALLSRGFREVRSSHERLSSAELFFSVVGLRPILGRR